MPSRIQQFFLSLALLCAAGALQAAEITWLGEYHDALQQAKKTNKPLFVEFRCEA